jgi:hypothetical protein
MEIYAESLKASKKLGCGAARFSGPTDRSHLRLGMQLIGMLETCKAIGFLKLSRSNAWFSQNVARKSLTGKSGQIRALGHGHEQTLGAVLLMDMDRWAEVSKEIDWTYTYQRPQGLWTHDAFGELGDRQTPLCYDLVEAIRSWLDENEAYRGLSMCEVALVDPRLRAARKHIGPANTFWSHVQQEEVTQMFRSMIAAGGGGNVSLKTKQKIRGNGDWPASVAWVDLFSLRQRTCDFHVEATLELIRGIGHVDAAANDGYFSRSFCLLEVYGAILGARERGAREGQGLDIHTAAGRATIESRTATTRRKEDSEKVSTFIVESFGGAADDAFAEFDKIASAALERAKEKAQKNYLVDCRVDLRSVGIAEHPTRRTGGDQAGRKQHSRSAAGIRRQRGRVGGLIN